MPNQSRPSSTASLVELERFRGLRLSSSERDQCAYVVLVLGPTPRFRETLTSIVSPASHKRRMTASLEETQQRSIKSCPAQSVSPLSVNFCSLNSVLFRLLRGRAFPQALPIGSIRPARNCALPARGINITPTLPRSHAPTPVPDPICTGKTP